MLMRFDPFREVDRLMGQVGATARTMPLSFPMDAVRRGDEVVVKLDLPGVEPGAIDVTAENGQLTISAERRFQQQQEGEQLLVQERPQGRFTRQLMLADTLDAEHLTASYDSGVLTLAIPVTQRAKPHRIAVSAAGREPGEPQTIEAQAAPDASPEPLAERRVQTSSAPVSG